MPTITRDQLKKSYVMIYELWAVAAIDCKPTLPIGQRFKQVMVGMFKDEVLEMRDLCAQLIKE